MKQQEHSPLIQQYYEIKQQHPETMLFFQVGDFYELFFDDARQAAACLGIALTARGKNKGEPIPLCGVPVHALDHYVRKLIKAGFKVAICDQLEVPKPGSLVRRGVKQVLTPGTLTDSTLLDDRSASYLFSFYPMNNAYGLVFSELLTAQIFVTVITGKPEKLLESELARFFPDEIIIPQNSWAKDFQSYFKRLGYCVSIVHDETVQEHSAVDAWLEQQFDSTLAARVQESEALHGALKYFYAYMSKNQRQSLEQFKSLVFYKSDDFLIFDAATQRNLELVKNAQSGDTKNTLFDLLDKAKTSMGSRMIKKWILRPLIDQNAIIQRQEVVGLFSSQLSFANQVEQILSKIGDLERIVGRIGLERASHADYKSLTGTLAMIPLCKHALQQYTASLLLTHVIYDAIGNFDALYTMLHAALYQGSEEDIIINHGFDEKLDHMRALVNDSNKMVADLEIAEQNATGISSLKIRYNNIQGYYIEITNTHKDSVPERYRRIQTLVGRERYTITQLHDLQYRIERANKEISVYEQHLFGEIKKAVAQNLHSLRKTAHALANLDALSALGRLAADFRYVRPTLNKEGEIRIKKGRHPVVERSSSTAFIPNDTLLSDDQMLWIITGPNMGGKSTYLRQVALLCVMAHIGSFVPAESADIALLDRIFTRLGASDNVAEGKSTFLVEMEETATICTQATQNSLVILDEVGRGTSTFDGLAIAQAVVEYIYTQIKARCLFATHYHELTLLESSLPGVVSYHVASKKTPSGIIFLYQVIAGTADGSFGIEVAKLADLPQAVVQRASALVSSFTNESSNLLPASPAFVPALVENHECCTTKPDLKQRIKSIDFDTLSPKKAFDILWELKEL